MNAERKQILSTLCWVALLIATTYGWWAMRVSASQLHESLAKAQECQAIVDDINDLRNRPGFAALDIDSPRTITARAEQASQQAQLPAGALVRIEPQSAIRLGDSPYRIRPTRLELRQVTLEQVIKFTHGMIDEGQGTTLRDLRLTAAAPPGSTAARADTWMAEVVLTQLIFAP